MTTICWCDGNGGEDCPDCGGEGGYHDCGEDCCCCLDPDRVTHACPTCKGKGWIRCPCSYDDDGDEAQGEIVT